MIKLNVYENLDQFINIFDTMPEYDEIIHLAVRSTPSCFLVIVMYINTEYFV